MTRASGGAFPGVSPHAILTAKGPGVDVRIGVVSVTIASNPAPYVAYANPLTSFQREVAVLKGQADVVVGLTHLAFADDQGLDLRLLTRQGQGAALPGGQQEEPPLPGFTDGRDLEGVHRIQLEDHRLSLVCEEGPTFGFETRTVGKTSKVEIGIGRFGAWEDA